MPIRGSDRKAASITAQTSDERNRQTTNRRKKDMLRNLRIKRGVAVLAAAGATLALVASAALANGPFAGPHGLVQFCVDTTGDTTGVPGTVRALAILGDCGPDAPLDIQQPFVYATSRESEP